MLSDGQMLLKAICADPDNDLPRLVYADYLEENGQAERAAFIRLQCEFVRKCFAGTGFADDPLRSELARLWDTHREQWWAELPRLSGVHWDIVFHRGFAERVVVETDTLLRDHAERILGFLPIHHLGIRRFTGAAGVTLIPALRRLKSATISLVLTHASVKELLAWTGFRPDLRLELHVTSAGSDADLRVPELNQHFRDQLHRPVVIPNPPRRRRNRPPEA